MNASSAPSRPRRALWPWFLGLLLAPPAAVALMAYSACRLDSDARALRQELVRATGTDWATEVQFSVPRLVFPIVQSGAACLRDLPPEARLALRSVQSASVGVYRRNAAAAPRTHGALLAAADAVMTRRGWTRLVGATDAGETVMIYLAGDGEQTAPHGVCVAVCNPQELVVVAAGVDPDALGALARRALARSGPVHL